METFENFAQSKKDMNVLDDQPDCFWHRLCTEDFTCNMCKAFDSGAMEVLQ